MAASAGTNPGSAPDGVAAGVGDGDVLADGVGVSDAPGEGEALGVAIGAGLTAAAGVHPATTMAIAMAGRPRAIRRRAVPLAMDIGRVGCLPACTLHARQKRVSIRPRHMPYAPSEDARAIRVALGNLPRRRREETQRAP